MAKKKRTPLAKIFVCALGFVLIFGAFAGVLLYDEPSLNSTDACPIEPGYTQVSLSIALDATDVYGPAQRREIVNKIWDYVYKMAVHDRIKMYTVVHGEQTPLLDLCKPGPSLKNSPAERKLRELEFKDFIEDALDALQGTQSSSPIIESIGWIAADYSRDDSTQRIVLVSDLIEHSDVISHYNPSWIEQYERNRSRILDQCPNLEGIHIDILVPTRSGVPTQNNDLYMWWSEYLTSCGGFVESITKITGIN